MVIFNFSGSSTAAQHAQTIDDGPEVNADTPLLSGIGEDTRRAKFILSDVAGARIRRAEPLLPGFRMAATAELAHVVSREQHKDRVNNQLESLTSRVDFRWPDAFIAPLEAAEEVLQRIAGGGRVARARVGEIVSDPVEWEGELANALLNDPCAPLEFESMRIPRPEPG
jgi:hypothetical protein